MRHFAPQTAKSAAARGRSSASSKRSNASSTSSESKCSDSSSGDPEVPKIVAKSLDPDFSAVAEEELFLDSPNSTPDHAGKAQISPLLAPSWPSDPSKLSKERLAMDRLREALIIAGDGRDGLGKCFDDLLEILMGVAGSEEGKGEVAVWSDPVFWAKVRLGIVAFLACWAAVLCAFVGSEVWSGDRTSFSGSPPT